MSESAEIPVYDCLFDFPVVVANTIDMPHQEWLALRKGFMGGSDAAPMMGLSRFKSPVGVFYEKTQNMQAEDTERSFQKKRMGNLMEPVIARLFQEEHPAKKVVRQPYFFRHPVFEHNAANIDYAILEPDGTISGLECKNTTMRRDFVDGQVPDEYYLQVQWYMDVIGINRFYLAYVLDGWEYHDVMIERNDGLIEQMRDAAYDFWNKNILGGEIPPFDGSEYAKQLLKQLYPMEKDGLEPVELPDDIGTMWQRENELGKAIGELVKQKDEIRNQISAMLGDAAMGTNSEWIFTYKSQTRSSYTVEETSYRVLRGKRRSLEAETKPKKKARGA